MGRSGSVAFISDVPLPLGTFWLPSGRPSLATGVGNSGDEDAIAAVRGAEGGSRKAIPLRVVPERGQAREYLVEEVAGVSSVWSKSKESCDVLHEHVAGSKLANASEHLSPKRSLGMPETRALASVRDALAGEAAGDELTSGKPSPNCSDVVEDGDSGEAPGEQAASELVLLAEEGVLESGEVEAVVEQATG